MAYKNPEYFVESFTDKHTRVIKAFTTISLLFWHFTINQVWVIFKAVLFFSLEQELIDHPYQTKSDSFYFVGGVLVMHNRADYAYNTEPLDDKEPV